jgi:hypothetical protein
MTNKKRIETPVGLADLSFSYHVAGADLPPAYEKAGAVILDSHTVVQPHSSMHGLFIYRVPDGKTRNFTVEIQATLPDGEVARMVAPYRQAKNRE